MKRAPLREMRFSSGLLALVLCAACASCGSSDHDDDDDGGHFSNTPDTCTQGDNMTAPRLAGAPEATGAETKIGIAWDRGTGVGEQLPATYFERVTLEEKTLVTRTAPAGERAMTIFLSGAPATHAGKTETFSLIFADRNKFTSCTHGGMNDVYSLAVTVTFSSDATSATATFEQKVALGDF
jgi:hypothetical protein